MSIAAHKHHNCPTCRCTEPFPTSARSDTTGPVIEAAKAVDAAVAEYFMHDALAGQMEVAARKAAVRGLMVRMGIYAQFNAALDEYDAEIREARHDR